MSRSRNQIASAYAPESFFTFEGGLGACLAKPLPTRSVEVSSATQNQIFERIEELARSWYDQAKHCRDGVAGAFEVLPRQCVDIGFLNGERSDFQSLNVGDVVLLHPSEMGYVPAPLTFVCETCKLVRTYDSVAKLDKDLAVLGDNSKCPHPKSAQKKCDWRQLDVMFVHWSGNWERAMPHQWHWDARQSKPVLRYEVCSCGSKDFVLDRHSPAIGDWFFRCAECNKAVSKKWLQNDPESIAMIGAAMANPARLTEVRMQATPYRASAVYYVQGDQFIDFKEGAGASLRLLMPGRHDQLKEFIGQRYGFGAVYPSETEMEAAALAGGAKADWDKYTAFVKQTKALEEALAKVPGDARRAMEESISILQIGQAMVRDDLVKRGIIRLRVSLPTALEENIVNRQTRFATRYDPFRLAVEHAALKETKLDPDVRVGGKRGFVMFDKLDDDLSPGDEAEKAKLEQQTRGLLNQLGIDAMGLIREFDLCRFTFGYSRMESGPVLRDKRYMDMPVRMNLFSKVQHEGRRKYPIYVVTQANEALYVRLQEDVVYRWLQTLGCVDAFTVDGNQLVGAGLLTHAYPMTRYLDRLPKGQQTHSYIYAYSLLHTYAHLMMRTVAEYSGLDLGSLGEYVFPADLAFVIYRSGTTMDLGNLSAMWRNANVAFLRALLRPKALLCGSGSLCTSRGGVCPDCLMVPETSCVAGNKLLSRSLLSSIGGRPPFDSRANFTVRGYLEAVEPGRRKSEARC